MDKELLPLKKTITVFGSSLPQPGEQEYEDAYQLGRLLGEAGFAVCTGGNLGIMEAVSKGAAEFNREVIGVVFHHFSARPNSYLTKKIETKSLFERIEYLIGLADGFVVLQGGTGTLLELSVIWEFRNKGLMKDKPIACHSALWERIIVPMEEQIRKENRKLGILRHFRTIDEIAKYLSAELAVGKSN
jgi:hypothetical protein